MKSLHPRCTIPLAALLALPLTVSAAPATTASAPATASASAPSSTTPVDPKDLKQINPKLSEKPANPLSVRIGAPLWSSAISGRLGVKGHVSNPGYISFTSIYDHLDYVVPGSVEVDYGKWGLLVEGQYTKLSDSVSTRDVLFTDGNIQMEQAFVDVNFSYKVVDTDKLTFAPFVGTRIEYASLHTQLTNRFHFVPDVDESGSAAWADPILGFGFKYQVLKPLALVAKADVGGFGAASHLTYQLLGGAQVQITRNLYSSLAYRYMSTDYQSGGFTYDVTYSGPQITFGVNF